VPETAQRLLRDRYDLGRQRETAHPTMNTVRRVDNQVSIVMQPALGNVWATPGPTANGDVDRFYHVNVSELLETEQVESARERVSPMAAPPSSPLPGSGGRMMKRYILRMVESPLPLGEQRRLSDHGAAVVLGQNSTAEVLAAQLAERDLRVYELSTHKGVDETLEELDRICAQSPVTQLFVMTGCGEDGEILENSALRQRCLSLPYFVCQRWVQRIQEAGLGGRRKMGCGVFVAAQEGN